MICCLNVLIRSVKWRQQIQTKLWQQLTKPHGVITTISICILWNFNINTNKKRQFDIEATHYRYNFVHTLVLHLCYVQVPKTLTLIWLMIVTCCLPVWGNFFRPRSYKANLCDFVRPKDRLIFFLSRTTYKELKKNAFLCHFILLLLAFGPHTHTHIGLHTGFICLKLPRSDEML